MVLKLENKRFGRLMVVRRIGKDDKVKYSRWECDCDCGETTFVITTNLTRGITKSCGCLAKEMGKLNNLKHGMANTRLHYIWDTMKQRCFNTNNRKYHNYGGRGITINDEWKNDFMAFYNWSIENNYNDELTLDRIDVNGNYEPNNCRWVTQEVQQNNRRDNVIITINGITKTAAQWEKEYNLRAGLVASRYNKGWKGERLLEEPKQASKQSGVKGVTWNKNMEMWQVRQIVNGKMTRIGKSKDLEEAISILNNYKSHN